MTKITIFIKKKRVLLVSGQTYSYWIFYAEGPIWQNTEISLFTQRTLEKLYIFRGTSENRNTVRQGNFVFEGRNTAKFQSEHRYCLNSSVSLSQEVNDILLSKSDQ